jgi:YVTN family beta-propeller protein
VRIDKNDVTKKFVLLPICLVVTSLLIIQPINVLGNMMYDHVLPLSYYPGDVAVNSITNTIYVSNSGFVTIINGTTNVAVNIPIGKNMEGIAVNPQTDMIYAIEEISNSVYVIDGHTDKVTQKISLPLAPSEISVNSNTNMIYVVVHGTKGGFYVINGTTNEIVDTVLGLGNSNSVAINPNTNRIYISNFSIVDRVPQTVSVVDGNPNKVMSTIILGNANCLTCTMPTSSGDMPIAVNPVTNVVYAGNFNDGKISVIDGTNNKIIGSITLAEKSLAIDNKKNIIYAAGGPIGKNGESHYVSVIDGSSNNIISTISSAGVTHRIAVNQVTGIAYVVNFDPIPSVSVLNYNLANTTHVIPEFPLTIPILLISVASLIVFYRIKIRK